MIDQIKNLTKYYDISTNLPKLAGYVEACGVDSTKIGKLIAQGMQHYIFEYGEDFVLKIPKFDLFNTFYGILRPKEVMGDWKLIRQFFEKYVVDTQIFGSQSTGFYVIVQARVKNYVFLNSKNIHSVIKEFKILHNRNHILESRLGYSLDLWGKSGIITSFLKSFGRTKVFVEMTNVILDLSKPKSPQIRIIDTNLYRTKGDKLTLSRILTDKIVYLFTDYFLRKGKFLN